MKVMRGSSCAHAAHQQADGMNQVGDFVFQSLVRHGELIVTCKQLNWQEKLASKTVNRRWSWIAG